MPACSCITLDVDQEDPIDPIGWQLTSGMGRYAWHYQGSTTRMWTICKTLNTAQPRSAGYRSSRSDSEAPQPNCLVVKVIAHDLQ